MKSMNRTPLRQSALLAFVGLLLTAGFALPVTAAGAPPVTVAVFDFEGPDRADPTVGRDVSALLSAQLSTVPELWLVERAELDKLLGEQELGLSGGVTPDTAAAVGLLTGARVLVTGRVIQAGQERLLVAKVISTETSRVFGQMARGAGKSAADLAEDLGRKVAGVIHTQRDALLPKAKSVPDRVAAIRQALEGKELPTVSVSLPERHFGGPTFDPAAETELGRVLKEVGFKVISADASPKADVTLTGEAFSEFGMRRGNLVSCAARVEIKAVATDGREVVAVDRQTTRALNLSEQIAAKTALQEAAAILAERVLPKLAK